MPPPVKVCLIKKGRRVREERKEAFLGGGPVESAPIAVIIIIMSVFGGDEWVGINRPKSFLIRDDKFQSSSALEMYYSASTAADSSSDSVSPLVLARTCSFFVALEKDKKHFIIIPATSTLQIWKMRRKKAFKKKIHYNP